MSPYRRELNPIERAILEFLLGQQFPGRDELKLQLASLKVVGGCNCGCESIDLSVDEGAAICAPVRERVPVEATTRVGPGVDVLLHVVDGLLRELEVYRQDGESAALPDPSSLELIVK